MPKYRGELAKLNLRQCNCGKVWVPIKQAAKVPGTRSGWHLSFREARDAFEATPGYDPVLRVSRSKRGRIVCPTCRGKLPQCQGIK